MSAQVGGDCDEETLTSFSTMSSLHPPLSSGGNALGANAPPYGFYEQFRQHYCTLSDDSDHASETCRTRRKQLTPTQRRRGRRTHSRSSEQRRAVSSSPRKRRYHAVQDNTKVEEESKGTTNYPHRFHQQDIPSRLEAENRYWAQRKLNSANPQQLSDARKKLVSQLHRLNGCSEKLEKDHKTLLDLGAPTFPLDLTSTVDDHVKYKGDRYTYDNSEGKGITRENSRRVTDEYAILKTRVSKDVAKGQKLLEAAKRKPSSGRRHGWSSKEENRNDQRREKKETAHKRGKKLRHAPLPSASEEPPQSDKRGCSIQSSVLNLSISGDERLFQKQKKLKEKIRSKDQAIAELEKDLVHHRQELDDLRKKNKDLESKYSSVREQQYDLKEQLSQERTNRSLLQDKLDWSHEQNQSLKQERETYFLTKRDLELQIEKQMKKRYDRQEELWEQRLKDLRSRLTRYYEGQIQSLSEALEASKSHENEMQQNKLKSARETWHDDSPADASFLREKVHELEKQVSSVERDRDTERRKSNEQEERNHKLTTDLDQKEDELEKMQRENNSLFEQLEQKRKSLHNTQHQLFIVQQELDDNKRELSHVREVSGQSIRKKEFQDTLYCFMLRIGELESDMERRFTTIRSRLDKVNDKHSNVAERMLTLKTSVASTKQNLLEKTNHAYSEGEMFYKEKLEKSEEERKRGELSHRQEIKGYQDSLESTRKALKAAEADTERYKQNWETTQQEIDAYKQQVEYFKNAHSEAREELNEMRLKFEKETSQSEDKSNQVGLLEQQLTREKTKLKETRKELSNTQEQLFKVEQSQENAEEWAKEHKKRSDEMFHRLKAEEQAAEQARSMSQRAYEELDAIHKSQQQEVSSLRAYISSLRQELSEIKKYGAEVSYSSELAGANADTTGITERNDANVPSLPSNSDVNHIEKSNPDEQLPDSKLTIAQPSGTEHAAFSSEISPRYELSTDKSYTSTAPRKGSESPGNVVTKPHDSDGSIHTGSDHATSDTIDVKDSNTDSITKPTATTSRRNDLTSQVNEKQVEAKIAKTIQDDTENSSIKCTTFVSQAGESRKSDSIQISQGNEINTVETKAEDSELSDLHNDSIQGSSSLHNRNVNVTNMSAASSFPFRGNEVDENDTNLSSATSPLQNITSEKQSAAKQFTESPPASQELVKTRQESDANVIETKSEDSDLSDWDDESPERSRGKRNVHVTNTEVEGNYIRCNKLDANDTTTSSATDRSHSSKLQNLTPEKDDDRIAAKKVKGDPASLEKECNKARRESEANAVAANSENSDFSDWDEKSPEGFRGHSDRNHHSTTNSKSKDSSVSRTIPQPVFLTSDTSYNEPTTSTTTAKAPLNYSTSRKLQIDSSSDEEKDDYSARLRSPVAAAIASKLIPEDTAPYNSSSEETSDRGQPYLALPDDEEENSSARSFPNHRKRHSRSSQKSENNQQENIAFASRVTSDDYNKQDLTVAGRVSQTVSKSLATSDTIRKGGSGYETHPGRTVDPRTSKASTPTKAASPENTNNTSTSHALQNEDHDDAVDSDSDSDSIETIPEIPEIQSTSIMSGQSTSENIGSKHENNRPSVSSPENTATRDECAKSSADSEVVALFQKVDRRDSGTSRRGKSFSSSEDMSTISQETRTTKVANLSDGKGSAETKISETTTETAVASDYNVCPYIKALQAVLDSPQESINRLLETKPVSDAMAVVAGAVCIVTGRKPSWKNATNFLKGENFRKEFWGANPLEISQNSANTIVNLVHSKNIRDYRNTISVDSANPAEIALLDWTLVLVDEVLENPNSTSYKYLKNHVRHQLITELNTSTYQTTSSRKQSSPKSPTSKLGRFLDSLQKGLIVYKYGRLWMKPKKRILRIEGDRNSTDRRITWRDPHSYKDSGSSILLKDITGIAKGTESEMVQKHAKNNDRERCLAIESNSRDFVFLFESRDQRDSVAAGLKQLLGSGQ